MAFPDAMSHFSLSESMAEWEWMRKVSSDRDLHFTGVNLLMWLTLPLLLVTSFDHCDLLGCQ